MRLIRPRLQLRLILTFLGTGALGLLLQYMLIAAALASVAEDLPSDGPQLMQSTGKLLLVVLLVSLGVLMPLVFFIGLWATHRFAGPIFRFESYLRSVARGEKPPDCRLRKGDELQELCDLINDATRPLRAPDPQPPPPSIASGTAVQPPLPRQSGSGVA